VPGPNGLEEYPAIPSVGLSQRLDENVLLQGLTPQSSCWAKPITHVGLLYITTIQT
jgi:hypothetical protein